MMKKDKNNQNINSIPKYLWGNYFKKPIKWLAHLINNYGNSKHPFITTGTSYAYAIGDEKRRHPELTELQIHEIINSRIKQNRKKLGLPTDNNITPSLTAAGLALGSVYYPWLAVPDIIFDTAASIDEPSTSNNIHTIADFPETVAKFTPSKIDDYVMKGVLTLGNIDDAVSTSGRNMFSNFDKKSGKINNTTDKTSVRESTNIRYRKNGGQIRKMLTASGGPINYKRWDDAKITSYNIPFIKEKAIKLTNAGRATGAVLSTNLLDSLADNAIRAGVPVRTAIGVSTKETTLGNPTDTKSAWNLSSGIRREFNGKYPGTYLHINPGRGLNERELVINYHKGHLSDTDTLGKSVILEALEFYKQHPDKYNTNQSDYQNLVNIIGEEVMKSPEILKWYREWEKSKAQIFRPEPYKINTNIQNTALEFIPFKKQGGKMNILEFLKKGSGIHIKEKNKGKFTSYCGGKVTSACIAKGKHSSNPAIRKRATFAANARKWKHKEGGIIKAEDGLSTSLLGLLPGVGTYLDYKEFEKNPNWKTGLSLGVSALGDATMLTGAGALIKGISAANKARKILGTAGKAANVARLLVWNQASKLKRESDAVNSLTLMNAPTNKILERQASKNLAKKSYEEALKNDEAALKVYLTAANNPALNFKSSQFTPLIYTNPGFHAGSLAIKHKLGGIIKAADGTKTNWWSKIGEGINKGVNSKAGLYIAQGLLLGLGSIFGGNNSSDISNAAKGYIEMRELLLDENELRRLNILLNSNIDPENPNAVEGIPKQVLYGKKYDIEQRNLKRKLKLEQEEMESLLNTLKSNLYLDIFSTALGVISNNNSNKTTKNNTSQLNGSPSKTTITSTNNNILKTGYEPYKSGYVDLFGNISTGMGFKFDKNFNVVPFDKSFNYQPLKLNV